MAEPVRTVLQLVLVNDTGDSYYRMRWPAHDVSRHRPDWRVINLNADSKERLHLAEAADLLVLYQSQDLEMLPVIERRRTAGKKTLVEYNDNFYAPPAWSPVAEPWSSPLMWQSYETILKASDGLLVTGPGLLELFSSKTKNPIFILENHLPESPKPLDELFFPPKDEFVIGWAGSLGHMADILSVYPVFESILKKYPQTRIHLMGNESLPAFLRAPADKLRFTPWGSMSDYFNFWRPVHLGIAPMLETAYNRCRSDIKAVEMAGCGALPVLQEELPYRAFVEQTRAPSYRTLDELEKIIVAYIDDPKKLGTDVARCYQYVRGNRVGHSRTERLELYEQFMPKSSDANSVNWPAGAGYFEISGTPQISTQSMAQLREVQQLWNQGEKEQARDKVTGYLAANPLNPDVALARTKILVKTRDAEAKSALEDAFKKFPRDVRFHLVSVASAADADERRRQWQAISAMLEQCPASREAFRAEIFKQLAHDLRALPQFTDVGELFSVHYSDFPEWNLVMAETYERLGEPAKALLHYEWLKNARDTLTRYSPALSTNESSYFAAWVEALKARTR
jgi:hypothetical protein